MASTQGNTDRQLPGLQGGEFSRYAQECLATLVEKGTDRYGIVHCPIWVLALNTHTLDAVRHFDDAIERIRHWRLAQGETMYSTYVPYGFGHRNIRVSQRPGGCSNLFVDQPMIRAAVLMDRLSGANAYGAAVEDYVHYYLDHFIDRQTGLIEWGVHTSYDVFEGCVSAADGHWHEVQVILPIWTVLWEIDAETMGEYLRSFWQWHVDPETGVVGRHPERGDGCNFAAAGAEMVLACAFMHSVEPDGPWLERALLVAHSHWDARHPDTNLFPNQIPTDRLKPRFDSEASDTSVPGLWASRVLMAGRLAGCPELVDMARDVLVAWATYGWDAQTQQPWAMIFPNGVPVQGAREQSHSYDKFAPKGHWNYWEDYVYGFEYPFRAMLSFAMGAHYTGDAQLVDHVRRLADCYVQRLPANEGMGTFAGNYGQLISFLLEVHALTSEAQYREAAEGVAAEAVGHLWAGRIFRGFPGKDYYEAIDGVGYLVQALAELNSSREDVERLREEDILMWNI